MLMKRTLAAVIFLVLGPISYGHAPAAQSARPNILWISCEDISPHLGCYGDPSAVTPTLDRLAAQGVRYSRAFTVAGVCAPNRSCIITGMYASSLGSQHMRCKATLPEQVKCFPEYLRAAGYYCTNRSKTDYNFSTPAAAWDESSKKAHWRNRPKGRPFFAVLNLTATHESRIHGGGRPSDDDPPPQDRGDLRKFDLPPYYPDTPVVRADWDKYYRQITEMDGQVAEILAELAEDGLARQTIVFYWSDHGVGLPRAKRWLYDSGTHVPLIVRIPQQLRTADQGRPGTVDGQLVSSVDLAPTVLNLAGVKIPPQMHGRAFLGKQLPPPRKYVFGHRDRMDERYDIIRSVRDKRYRYIRNYEPLKAYYQYMNTPEKGATMKELRRWHAADKLPPAAELFMAETKPPEELYDLDNDPHEIHNLLAPRKTPASGRKTTVLTHQQRDVLERLRAAHVDWVRRTKDLGLLPEPEIVARAEKYGSGYAILRQPGAEDLAGHIQRVAASSGQGKAALPELAEAIHDEDTAVRYWAAIGLGNLGGDAKSAAGPLSEALEDTSPSVRIAAARALCLMDLDAEALPVLTRELKSDRQWVRLNAAIVLDGIGEKARPCIAALRDAHKDKQNKYVVRVANRALNVLEGTSRTVR